MLLPRVFGEDLFDEWMDFPGMRSFGDIDKKLYGKNAARVMKTDVHEREDGFQLSIDLPGFKKEEISLTLENGYLNVSATKGLDEEHKDKHGKLIRQERYSGSMQRSFYVGDAITEEDIQAKYENGVLCLSIPKKEPQQVAAKKTIAIAG
ncbi:MAG: Hsp20/alpha crystallin family protein [Lachnospiraceae bacterium]|nr:Hsp20/alpha crystallin family protein [Lachnospiraceae bacterium]